MDIQWMQIGDEFSYPMDISKWISWDFPLVVRRGNVSQRTAGRPLDILRTKRATRVFPKKIRAYVNSASLIQI